MNRQKERMCIAFKGGHNDELHNHNDVGSFLVIVDGEVILSDLGCEAVTVKYVD